MSGHVGSVWMVLNSSVFVEVMNICHDGGDLRASGVWEDPYDTANMALMEFDMWMRELPPLERVYVCPLCGYVHRSRGVILRPTCPRHRREMRWYVPQLAEGSKLKEWLKDLLARKLMVLNSLARQYAGRPPDKWRLYAPPAVELAFDCGDPTVFRYAWWHNMFEAYLLEVQFLSNLKKVVDYFGLELCVEIPRHAATAAPPGAVYDNKKDVYRIVVTP
jgi:hypothetical protein